MKILPFVLILLVFLAANFYIFSRFWQLMPANLIGRVLLVVCGILFVSSIFLYVLLVDSMPVLLTTAIYKIGTSWIFIFLYFLMLFLVLDLLKLTRWLPLHNWLHGNWWGFAGVIGVVFFIMAMGYVRYTHKKRVELTLHIDKQTAGNKPLKIVAVSDIHLGYGIGKKELQKWVELINNEHPDVVLIAGDVIDTSIKPLYHQHMAETFKEIKATYGIYTCLGNHEYISDVSKSIKFLESAGIQVLKDSVALVDDLFYIVGRDDRSNPRRKLLRQLTDSLDRSKPVIVLDHQPYHLEEAEKNQVDFQFSGHTHRGQVWPISWVTDKIYEDSHGYLQKGNTHIYVSSGLGIWGGKFRIGTQSEYVVVNLITR